MTRHHLADLNVRRVWVALALAFAMPAFVHCGSGEGTPPATSAGHGGDDTTGSGGLGRGSAGSGNASAAAGKSSGNGGIAGTSAQTSAGNGGTTGAGAAGRMEARAPLQLRAQAAAQWVAAHRAARRRSAQ